MKHVPMYSDEGHLRSALERYKGRLATYWKVVKEFKAHKLTHDELQRYPIVKKSTYMDFGFGYNTREERKVIEVLSRHSGFKARLVGWDSEPYQGASRWGDPGDAGWNTVWLHFETTTDIGLPFHMPLNLAVQNGKTASVWQDMLLEHGLVENTDFKYNNLGDMVILSDFGKDAVEYVTPPKPMVLQFDAQLPVNELNGQIKAYWDKTWPKGEQRLFPRFRVEACNIGIDLV